MVPLGWIVTPMVSGVPCCAMPAIGEPSGLAPGACCCASGVRSACNTDGSMGGGAAVVVAVGGAAVAVAVGAGPVVVVAGALA